MKVNMSNVDRFVRILIGVLIASLGYTHVVRGNVGLIVMGVAGVIVLTSILGFCPLYSLLGIHTNSANKTTT